MNYKNAITMTTLSVIAVFAIVSVAGFGIHDTEAIPLAVQPEKFVFVEKVSTTASFEFRDGSETVAIQQFSQLSGFGSKSLVQNDDPRADGGKSSRATPAFTLEKIVGNTPYLYAAADQAQQYYINSGFEYPYKIFDVTVYVSDSTNVFRTFEYRDCQVTNYVVVTRSDNEEGYTGKGFAVVDQISFECGGYTPHNPLMEKMKVVEHAKTTSSSDLKSTDTWEPGFKKQ